MARSLQQRGRRNNKHLYQEYLKKQLCLSDLDIMILLELPAYQEAMIKKLVGRGYSERTIRYRITQLVRAGVVKRSRREPYRDKSVRWVHLDLTYNWKGIIGRLADKHIKK